MLYPRPWKASLSRMHHNGILRCFQGDRGQRSHLLKEVPHLAHHASLLHGIQEATVTIGQEVVTQDGSVGQSLHYAVHETRVA